MADQTIAPIRIFRINHWCFVAAATEPEARAWFDSRPEIRGDDDQADDVFPVSSSGLVNTAEEGEPPVLRTYERLVAEHIEGGGSLPFQVAMREP